ncbi:hypothetical protein [uncultured Alistipes sp.]|uniref:hypothetical protein n=1 Tax=uncultured Alistipes sp. TaxID=538949 RepID=UPI0034A0154B
MLPNTTDEARSAEIRLSAGQAEQIVTLTVISNSRPRPKCGPSSNGSIETA